MRMNVIRSTSYSYNRKMKTVEIVLRRQLGWRKEFNGGHISNKDIL
jgi:hypothetical protein